MGPPGCPGRWLQGLATAAAVTPRVDPGKVGGVLGFRDLRNRPDQTLNLSQCLVGDLEEILALRDDDRRRKREKGNNLTQM